jgi:DNA-binding HxlR family transcriptional regulator
MSKRSYNQLCAFARGLDLIGDRWTLLIMRDLMLGPQRYVDLLDGLPGIGTGLLAKRLKEMEQAGIVRRRKLPRPAASIVYELTEAGRELDEPLLAIGLWGLWHGAPPRPGMIFRPSWGILSLKAIGLSRPDELKGVHYTYECHLDGEVFHLLVNDGRIEAGYGPPSSPPDLVAGCDVATFFALGAGALSPTDAVASGRWKMQGDSAAFIRFWKIFGLLA